MGGSLCKNVDICHPFLWALALALALASFVLTKTTTPCLFIATAVVVLPFFFFSFVFPPLAQRRMGIPAVQSPEDRLKEKLNRLFQDVLSDVNRTKVPTSFLCLFFILYFVHVFYLSTVA